MNDDITNISDFDDDLTISGSNLSSISSASIVNGSLWYSNNNWSTIGQPVFDIENLTDMFIVMMKDLSEDQIISILNSVKERQPSNYNHCLVNLIAYPNLKLMSEQFLIERYEDIKKAMSDTHKNIDLTMVYGNLLDQMPAFKLLIELKK
jgi:hypothetical protein